MRKITVCNRSTIEPLEEIEYTPQHSVIFAINDIEFIVNFTYDGLEVRTVNANLEVKPLGRNDIVVKAFRK